MSEKIRVTVWSEFRQEKTDKLVASTYPDGIHGAIAAAISGQDDFEVRCATLDDPDDGLPREILDSTDVLTWWGHLAHEDVADETVARVRKRVLEGMGLIVLHSAHFSKIFKALMGTNCSLKWREVGERERVWVIERSHPIAAGLDEYFELPATEMYGERFDIPKPDELVFVSWFQGGEVFRSGCCWRRGHGKVFYFRPGHETLPIFKDANIKRVLINAVRWARPLVRIVDECPNAKPLEKL